ncbi:unnamed protein product, partial [marine sediment metagenome]
GQKLHQAKVELVVKAQQTGKVMSKPGNLPKVKPLERPVSLVLNRG